MPERLEFQLFGGGEDPRTRRSIVEWSLVGLDPSHQDEHDTDSTVATDSNKQLAGVLLLDFMAWNQSHAMQSSKRTLCVRWRLGSPGCHASPPGNVAVWFSSLVIEPLQRFLGAPSEKLQPVSSTLPPQNPTSLACLRLQLTDI